MCVYLMSTTPLGWTVGWLVRFAGSGDAAFPGIAVRAEGGIEPPAWEKPWERVAPQRERWRTKKIAKLTEKKTLSKIYLLSKFTEKLKKKKRCNQAPYYIKLKCFSYFFIFAWLGLISADFWFIFVSLILYTIFLKLNILDIKLKCFSYMPSLEGMLLGEGRAEICSMWTVTRMIMICECFLFLFLTSCCCIWLKTELCV